MKVVASGVGVEVEDFTREVKAGYQFRFHSFGVDFLGVDPALGDDGGIVIAGAVEGEVKVFKEMEEPTAFGAVDLVEAFVVFDVEAFEGCRDEFGGEPEAECVVEEAVAVAVEVVDEPVVEGVGVDGGFEVDMGLEGFSVVEETADKAAGREDERTVEAEGGEGQFAEAVEEFLAIGTGDSEVDVLEDKTDEVVLDRFFAGEGDEGRYLRGDLVTGFGSQTIAKAGGAGGGVGESAGGDDDGVGTEGGAVLKADTVEVFGKAFHGTVFAYLNIGASLEVVDEGEEDVEGLTAAGEDAMAAFFDKGDVALLEELHQLGVEEEGETVAHESAVGTDMGKEILEGSSVGEVAPTLARDAEFASGLVHFLEKDDFGALLGSGYGGHHAGSPGTDNDYTAHDLERVKVSEGWTQSTGNWELWTIC